MPLDMMPHGDPFGPMCNVCKAPIGSAPAKRIDFATDPYGDKGLTGDYHVACAKPFESLARIVSLNPYARF